MSKGADSRKGVIKVRRRLLLSYRGQSETKMTVVVRESWWSTNMSFDAISKTQKDKQVITNENNMRDVSETFRNTRWLLWILGVWAMFSKNPKKWELYISKIIMIMCWSNMLIFTISGTIYIFFIEKNIIAKIKLFLPIGFGYTNTVKYCSIIFHREMIKRCMEHIELDWRLIESKTHHEIMSRNKNIGHRLTLVCATFMYAGGLSYQAIFLRPLWHGAEKNELNETVWPLIYPFFDGFVDGQRTPYFQIIFVSTCLWACIGFTITTAACNLAAIFVTHACGQIEVIMSHLDTLFDSTDSTSEMIKARLGFVVKSHVRVLRSFIKIANSSTIMTLLVFLLICATVFHPPPHRMTTIIEKLFREICLADVVTSILIICLLEYCCLMEWENSDTLAIITYLELFLSMVFNIFIFCHIGEILKEHCYQLGRAAYTMNWYRLPGKTGLTIILVMAIANSPRKITAGRLMELSMTSFGSIIKTSFAYLNMLRTMTV